MSTLYIPERNDIIWLDFEPTKGKEIGKYRPALIFGSYDYHRKTGLLICSPISTSIRNVKTEVPVRNLNEPSVVASGLIQTLSWKNRKSQFIAKVEAGVLEEVLQRLLPLMGAEAVLKNLIGASR